MRDLLWPVGAAAALVFALAASAEGQELTVQEIRRGFSLALEDPAARASLEEAVRSAWPRIEDAPVVIRAYAAVLRGLEGRQTRGLLDKARIVREGITLFAGLVESAPQDLEVRFLRYSFFSELPFLFGVSGLVLQDRAALIQMLSRRDFSAVPAEMQRYMIERMLSGVPLDDEDRTRLRSLLGTKRVEELPA